MKVALLCLFLRLLPPLVGLAVLHRHYSREQNGDSAGERLDCLLAYLCFFYKLTDGA